MSTAALQMAGPPSYMLGASRLSLARDVAAKIVLEHYGLDSLGEHRDARHAWARQVLMWLLREYTASSWEQIGAAVGQKERGTARHGWQKVVDARNSYAEVKLETDRLLAALCQARERGEE